VHYKGLFEMSAQKDVMSMSLDELREELQRARETLTLIDNIVDNGQSARVRILRIAAHSESYKKGQ
jgi:hypothetical protein